MMSLLLLLTALLVFPTQYSIKCDSYWLNAFPIQQTKSDSSKILSEIISNYIDKFFSEDQFFVSIILKSSKNDHQFEEDFFVQLFNDLNHTEFAHNIIDQLENETYDNMNAFNLILVDDSCILS